MYNKYVKKNIEVIKTSLGQDESIYPLPHTSSWGDAYLVNHKDNITF
jgi:hypothetical protein